MENIQINKLKPNFTPDQRIKYLIVEMENKWKQNFDYLLLFCQIFIFRNIKSIKKRRYFENCKLSIKK